MQLLVSVASEDEAKSALEGGADIIDAKDPQVGSLGPVSRRTLAEIRTVVPASIPLSAALGDVASSADVEVAFDLVIEPLQFVKIGFRGVVEAGTVAALLGQSVTRAARLPGTPRLVAVGYADFLRAGSLPPIAIAALAARAGADGILVDTAFKDGGSLFELLDLTQLTLLGSLLARHELCFAVGGSLGVPDFAGAHSVGADIVGVRGRCVRRPAVRLGKRELRPAASAGDQTAGHRAHPLSSAGSRSISPAPITSHRSPSASAFWKYGSVSSVPPATGLISTRRSAPRRLER